MCQVQKPALEVQKSSKQYIYCIAGCEEAKAMAAIEH